MTESKKFCCETCKFSTPSNYSLDVHFGTKKHIKNVQLSNGDINSKYQCPNCNKNYKGSSSLWAHKIICKEIKVDEVNVINSSIVVPDPNIQKILDEMIKMNELTRQSNQETRQSNQETRQSNQQLNLRMDKLTDDLQQNQQQIVPTTINNNDNSTTINNTFNMNIFLNESCGQAINFDDFIKHLFFENADASKMIGSYVEGTCNIIQKNLEELPLNRRPLHYLVGEDPHQNLIHIRQDDKWNVNSELNWMQQLHSDDDDTVVDKNPIYYALKKIDDDKLAYLAYYFNQSKEYMLQDGRLVREISRPDFKDIVYKKMIKMITLDINNLVGIDVKSKIDKSLLV
jgi:hypothetical protein